MMGLAALLLALAVQNPEDLKPGLVAEYRSLVDPSATLTRIDAKPAFTLGDSSPHPRIPPGPFEVVWTGFILIQDAEPLTFGGDATIDIDGAAVNGPVTLKPGFHRIRITSRARRVQLTWEGRSVSREPIPPGKFRHAPVVLPELRGRERADFEKALRWEVLRPHLEAMCTESVGAVAAGQIRAGLDAVEASESLVLLRIADYGFQGLTRH
jgi:hypothetical protein